MANIKAFTRSVVGVLAFCAILLSPIDLAFAETGHRYHIAHRAYPPRISHRDLSGHAASGFEFEAIHPYQAYDDFQHNPLIPLKQETPPPVDPNEPTSGSYGAMVHGFNAAGTGY